MKIVLFLLFFSIGINGFYGTLSNYASNPIDTVQEGERLTTILPFPVQTPSSVLYGGLNIFSFFQNIKDGSMNHRYRLYLLVITLIVIGIVFGTLYPRMTQPPIQK